jgi:2-polyprenyl-3-methyl-5-hydroxy-6-metoxy-1,4-benzoquinol methylase
LNKKYSNIFDFYNGLYMYYMDNNSLLVGWKSKESQYLRFRTIVECGLKNNDSVLDVGCGVGDFLAYCKENNLIFDYVGIDIYEDFINMCKNSYPKNNFIKCGLEEYNFDRKFDWCIASGTYNVILTYDYFDNIEYIKQNIVKMFNLCNKGCIFNLLFGERNSMDDGILYFDAFTILKNFIIPITNKFLFSTDYKNNDCTICLYR